MFSKLLKPAEVAVLLSISKALAYRLIATSQIPSVRFGRTVRVKPEDLEVFIQQSSTQNTDSLSVLGNGIGGNNGQL